MKIDFNRVLLAPNGTDPLVFQGSPLMMKDVCIRALLDKASREVLNEDEFIHRYKLILAIQQAKEPLETPDADLITIKKLLFEVQGYSVFVVGQALECLRSS